jgi:hypothetical protein
VTDFLTEAETAFSRDSANRSVGLTVYLGGQLVGD